jgi:hypothetical protein
MQYCGNAPRAFRQLRPGLLPNKSFYHLCSGQELLRSKHNENDARMTRVQIQVLTYANLHLDRKQLPGNQASEESVCEQGFCRPEDRPKEQGQL